MALAFLQDTQRADAIPRGLTITHLIELLDETKSSRIPEMEWKWAVLGIAHNAMVSNDHHHVHTNATVFENESRLRASAFLQLAFLDSRVLACGAFREGVNQWNSTFPVDLLQVYKSLANFRGHQPLKFEHHLKAMMIGLILTYRPMIDISDVSINITTLRLTPCRGRSLLLSAGLLVQDFLQRASAFGLAASLNINLIKTSSQTHRLTIHTSEKISKILSSEYFSIASRLLGTCQADFTCRAAPLTGTIFEIIFDEDA